MIVFENGINFCLKKDEVTKLLTEKFTKKKKSLVVWNPLSKNCFINYTKLVCDVFCTMK